MIKKMFFFVAIFVFVACKNDLKIDHFVDERDGNDYEIVQIGDRFWMAENLNYKMDSSWCYDNEEKNCQKFGRLYQWREAISACPDGWMLPSFDDFFSLVNYVDSVMNGKKNVLERECTWACGQLSVSAGKYLKTQAEWIGLGNGTDLFGFSAKPAGFLSQGDTQNHFTWMNEKTFYWSTKISDYEKNPFIFLLSSDDVVDFYSVSPRSGVSIRCVKSKI
ncbi:FISUMP domain-containing protein [Fibrobacter succinogenes]|uniref:FISUMP domain-containing protein n=1 Tax=Fibrobacter succinogenes TaxID=833 RepID=UPI00156A3CFF|nr:FISUMP domain-containing protein [Fibrobacter succinogenes]